MPSLYLATTSQQRWWKILKKKVSKTLKDCDNSTCIDCTNHYLHSDCALVCIAFFIIPHNYKSYTQKTLVGQPSVTMLIVFFNAMQQNPSEWQLILLKQSKFNLTKLTELIYFILPQLHSRKAAESGDGKHPGASASIDSSKYMCQVFYQSRGEDKWKATLAFSPHHMSDVHVSVCVL